MLCLQMEQHEVGCVSRDDTKLLVGSDGYKLTNDKSLGVRAALASAST